MKKYSMLIFTLIIFFITSFIYFYENTNLPALNEKHPRVSISSRKYGHIQNIIWSNFDEEHILILASNTNELSNDEISTLYTVNIEKGDIKRIYEFPTHKNLKSYLQKTELLSSWLYVAFPKGVYELTLDNDYSAKTKFFKLEDFEAANSLSVSNNIIFTKDNDNLLYLKDFSMFSFDFLNRNPNKSSIKVYSVKPQYALSGGINDGIFYTKLRRNGLNLYNLIIKNNITIKNKLIAKNIISMNPTSGNNSIKGLISDKDKYAIYELKRIDDKRKKNYEVKLINTIPKNTDILGQHPSIDGWNYRTIYTSFKGDHNGSIIKQEYDEIREIIKDEPIVGPIRISCDGNRILFFTYETSRFHMKICDADGNNLKDISKIIE